MSSLAALQSDAELASAEVLGTVAHELRQPLSNIEAIAYYLSMVLPAGETKIQAQLARIRELVEQSSWILSSGVRMAGSAPSTPQPLSLEELITESVSSSSAARGNVILALSGDLPLVLLDPRDGRELVDSVLMLFRSMAAGGPITVTTSVHPGGGALLEIHASGDFPQGICGAGSELAVQSACRIAESHGGTFNVDQSLASGIRGRLMLP